MLYEAGVMLQKAQESPVPNNVYQNQIQGDRNGQLFQYE